MQVNLLQIHVEESPEANIEKVINLTKGIKNQLIILPELFTTGFNYDHVRKHVKSQPELLKKLPVSNTYIGSIARQVDNSIYNSFFVKKGDNLEFIYEKIHLFPLMDEHIHFKSGNNTKIFEIDNFKCGCAICFDLRFPELFRQYFLNSVEVVFIPMQWPHSRIKQMIPLATARAIENQCYVVVCNAVGNIWGTYFGGNSMVISPTGELLVSAKENADKIYSTILKKDVINDFRQAMPIAKCLKLL
ncbi:nitrilase [Deferribacterales bacterium Es71-Z0220]|jgi:predicted amidohydrolase|uniref:nitrilase-related carbon-nitrogen hydrolase n=1 Tax=Deferrivibrio essentukiensis TaxID=2880922 RepID=UPI001F61698C|nr:nitrilase-related carbon-nitrogen hydrolase [Deferrivibrio essentukiensis]MBZ4672264.1 Nitrilase/cyanide hydratase and apolipoprotein N-acyltransferase [Deferribacteraceae bacterium]MCB4203604.1 nitrilase [Deferrivibrio essentukiensis]